MKHHIKWLLGTAAAVCLVVLGVVSMGQQPAARASGDILTRTDLIAGSEIGVWEADGGPALDTPAVTADITATGTPVMRWGLYDCFTGTTCGSDNHAGTMSEPAFQAGISGIVNTLHAIPLIKLSPMSKDSINGITPGSDFCPPPANWAMNLPFYKQELQAIAAVYTGPIILESSNEAEYDCWSSWGFGSAGAIGVSTDIGDMYAATMPALKTYAQGLGFSQVVTMGYIGVSGGPGWGQACTASASAPYGYSCAVSDRWIDEFNQAVLAAGAPAPDVESVHSYCHSPDFAPAPYTFPDNECYAFQREWLTNSRAQVDSIWGSAIGDNIRFSVSEWNAGDANTGGTWSGFSGCPAACTSAPGSYDDGYLSMLAGNGVTTGTGTAYWNANLFEWASNNSSPGNDYDIALANGSVPAWYSNVKADFLGIEGTAPSPSPSTTSPVPTPTPTTTTPTPAPTTTSPSPSPTPTRRHHHHWA